MQAIQILIAAMIDALRAHLHRARTSASVGASTVEYILMALLGIGIALAVTAAITAWVNGKIGQLGS